jgi:hypothetical protein
MKSHTSKRRAAVRRLLNSDVVRSASPAARQWLADLLLRGEFAASSSAQQQRSKNNAATMP